jgi:putative acyl-CoA dehydrogenase
VSPGPRATHEVTNQAPPLDCIDTFGENRPLVEAVRREAGDWALEPLHRLGSLAGTLAAIRWAREANEHPPVLRTHDRFGNRIDEVEFHPSWDHLLGISIDHGIHARPWREAGPGAHAARAAAMIVMSGLEAGHGCPISMTMRRCPPCGWSRTWPGSGSRASSRWTTTLGWLRPTASEGAWRGWP